ncbi:cupin domain-containing protein [Alphaproteobacteria bacterium]|nr:cupin domain-containing protein [Alphaproteobacteria bacterium]
MQNSSILKNELIFEYAAGTSSIAKSLIASSYLYLNSKESSLYNEFESYCGEELKNTKEIKPSTLKAEDCIMERKNNTKIKDIKQTNPLDKFVNIYSDINWKKIFKGFYEHSLSLPNNEKAKIIKMDPGSKVPLHSHNGKEYILVLEGSFNDEYGSYSKGDLQINDSNIKHTPIASKTEGCICLSITEKELVFYGPFAPILNLITVIKMFLLNK